MENTNSNQGQNEIMQQADEDQPSITENLQIDNSVNSGTDFFQASEVNISTDKVNKRETADNSGSMFKNDRKSKESHPDITGSAIVNGAEFYVSGWRKTGSKGDFYSLSFRPKDTPASSQELI